MYLVVTVLDCLGEVTKEECVEGNSRGLRTEPWGTEP